MFPKPFIILSASLLLSLTACKPTQKAESITQNNTNVERNLSPANNTPILTKTTPQNSSQNSLNCNNQAIFKAFSQKNENQKIQVLGCGQVKKVLKDDNDGSRHQKFLITIDGYPQISVLVAHNIDLAKRVENIQPNTPIRFYGEYIYNDKGGVLHWTHKDPTARHQDGWLEYNEQKYW